LEEVFNSESIMKTSNMQIESLLFECVERALEPLGYNARESIFRLFEARTSIPRKKIFSNSDAFLIHLQSLFGKPAAKTLEMAIKREIIRRFDLQNDSSEELPELINEIKQRIQKQNE
jgi:hypothetical protein